MNLRSRGSTSLQPLVDIGRLEKERAREARAERERQDHLNRLGMAHNMRDDELHGVGVENVRGRMPVHPPRGERRIGDFDEPVTNSERMGIRAPPCGTNNWEIKSSLINMVQNNRFFGLPMEHPIEHIDNFERLCATVRMNGVSEDVIKLTLFPFSLGDKAAQWEKSVVSATITTWEECKKRFLSKFFSNQRTARIRNDIATFKQGGNESFYEALERFKGYTRSCPHHGVSKESLLGIFHRGVHEKYYMALNTASNGSFASLTVEQGEQLIENLAQSNECYGGDYDRTVREPKSDDARFKAMNDKLDKFIMSTQKATNYVGEYDCNQEGSMETYQEGQEEAHYMQGGYNNQQRGFNPNYRNNNLSYRSTNVENPQDQVYPQQKPQGQGFIPQQQGFVAKPQFYPQGNQSYQQGNFQPKAQFFPNNQGFQQQGNQNYQGQGSSSSPQPKSDETNLLLKQLLEGQGKNAMEVNKKMTEIHNKVDGAYNDLHAKFEHLSTHMKALDNQIAQVASTSKRPVGTLPGKPEANPREFCNAIFNDDEKEVENRSQQEENEKAIEEIARLLMSPCDEFVDLARNVREGTKRGNTMPKSVEEEKVAEVVKPYEPPSPPKLEPKSIPKIGNPGKFTIPCCFGSCDIEEALCDSGASVNVISLEMVKRLGIKGMKHTSLPIMFADASSKQAIGTIDDHPLKVGNCIVPTDLMVMEMAKTRKISLILGTPFLSTAGANIDFINKRVVLQNVDDKVFYPIKPSTTALCGTITKEDMGNEDEFKELLGKNDEARGKNVKAKPLPLRIFDGDGDLLDGECLNRLFANPEDEDRLVGMSKETHPPFLMNKGRGTLKKSKKVSPKMTLTPRKHNDGVLDYRVKCKGMSKPFEKIKPLMPPKVKEKGQESLNAFMKEMFSFEIHERGTSINPPLRAHPATNDPP